MGAINPGASSPSPLVRDGIVALCPCFVRERGTKWGKTEQLGKHGFQRLLALSWLTLPGLACGIGLLTGGL